MNPDNWPKVKDIFDRALARPADEREAFVRAACAGDEALRQEVDSFLRSHQNAESFMETPAAQSTAQSLAGEGKLVAGQQITHYVIQALVGEGGMGQVYLAQDLTLKRKVALKVLPVDVVGNAERMRRFRQEATAAAALNHPNIAHIYEVGEDDGVHFIAMEYVEGATLRQLIHDRRTDLPKLLRYLQHVAEGLSRAHTAGIVHRDLKPDNIMVSRDGHAKILDFGLAKLVERRTVSGSGNSEFATAILPQHSLPGTVMGTLGYMSPEQAHGKTNEIDHRSDIFSFGCILFEVVTGRRAFEGSDVVDSLNKTIRQPAPSITEINPSAPADLQRIVRRCLAKEPERRYQSIKEVAIEIDDLRRELNSSAAEYSTPASSSSAIKSQGRQEASGTLHTATTEVQSAASAEYPVDKIKRRKRTIRISAVAVITIAIIGAVVLLSWQRSRVGRTPSLRTLARLTFDTGLQSEPTWSPDGKFVAYSSDQSGNFEIWVKPLGEGDPIQVTKSPAHDWQPDWSPDGQRLVFRSEREGGGLYVVPAFGGAERKVSASGYRPRWSPEGSQILFLSSALQITVEVPKLYVVTLDGKPPRQILDDFRSQFVTYLRVAWHPDGKRISLWGLHRKLGKSFWTAALAGGAPVKSDFTADVAQRLSEADVLFTNFRWASSGRALFFEGISHEVRNLWKIEVDPQTLRWEGGPERLTTGSGVDTDIAISPDGKKLAFSTRTERTRIWAVPTSPTAGAGQPVTPAEMDAWTPDITPDGKNLVFVARRASKLGVWTKSLPDGREALLAGSDDLIRTYPRWSRDGTRLVYRRIRPRNKERPEDETSLVLMAASAGDEQLLADLAAVPSDWAADGNSVLVWSEHLTADRSSICMLSTTAAPHAESQIRLVVSSPEHNLYNARFSPDERWIAFNAIRADDPEASTVYVVSSTGGEWKRITESKYRDAKPRWSPDGKTIYFVSNRGGFFNVWGVQFDPVTGQTQGESFRVTAFDSPGRMVFPNVQEMDISIAGDRLVIPIMEVSGSLWILENVDR